MADLLFGMMEYANSNSPIMIYRFRLGTVKSVSDCKHSNRDKSDHEIAKIKTGNCAHVEKMLQ